MEQGNVIQNLINVAQNSLETTYFPQDYNAMLNGLSCVPDESILEKYIRYSLQGYYPTQLLDYVAQNDVLPNGSRLYNFMVNNLIDVVKSTNFERFVQNMVIGWSTDAQLSQLNSFDWQSLILNSEQANAWNNAISRVNQTRSWLNSYKKDISDWLNSNFS
uniref:Aminopeptidase N n=1 Tax=Acrobeloides nanus TaxID=290746 RepID=A0A914ECI4_9BILA